MKDDNRLVKFGAYPLTPMCVSHSLAMHLQKLVVGLVDRIHRVLFYLIGPTNRWALILPKPKLGAKRPRLRRQVLSRCSSGPIVSDEATAAAI